MLSNLTDAELHSRTLLVSNEEKNANYRLLEHLNETERRRSYLALGHHSLWDYVERGLGYSHAQTSERVASTAATIAVPEALEAIARKSLSITTAAQIGRTIRNGKKSAEEARSIFEECDGKSSREIERILLPDATVPRPDRVRAVTKTTTSIHIEVDDEFMALAKRAMQLSGEFSMKTVLLKALEKYVKSKEIPKSRAPNSNSNLDSDGDPTVGTGASPATEARREESSGDVPPADMRVPAGRYIPSGTRRVVRNRSRDQCEFVSRRAASPTPNRCSARTKLEFHHLNPYARFGSHHPKNLMHVCRSHHFFLERRLSVLVPKSDPTTKRPA